jgi:hypothetical protein
LAYSQQLLRATLPLPLHLPLHLELPAETPILSISFM